MKKTLSATIIFSIILLMFSMLTLQVKAEANTTQYPWPMFHHNLRHTGFSPSPAPTVNNILWTFETDDRIASSPAVANGKVIIGSMDNKTYALDQFSGTMLWNTELDHYMFLGSPAIDSNHVFLPVGDEILALDEATGSIIWRKKIGGVDFSSPAVADSVVFAGSISEGPMGNVFALDANTGNVIWSYSDKTGVASSPAVSDGMVFVSSMKFSVYGIPGKVFALDQSTGELIWATEIGDGAFVSSPAVSEGRVFVGSNEGYVYALDEYTGSILWQGQTGGQVFSSPAVAYGKIYIGCYDGRIYAFDQANGDNVWTFQTGDRVEASSPAVADGKVFVGSDDGNLYALDATTGSKIWNYTTGHWVESSPAVVDGIVYVGSLDGKVYAFGSLGPLPPVADFTCSPSSPDIFQRVHFDASASYDPDGGRIVSYVWDFGDGKSQRGISVAHRYRSEGTYFVTLTVIDDEAQTGTTSASIVVAIRMYYELYVEIDWLEGYAPSIESLAYIVNYFKESARMRISIEWDETIKHDAWQQIDADEITTDNEFWEFEQIYNNKGDDKIDPNPVLTSKWKWILFGAQRVDSDEYGSSRTYGEYRWTAGNYVFISQESIKKFATRTGYSHEEVETMVIMHEIGHSIGISDYRFNPRSEEWEENYDGNPLSVMTQVDNYIFNNEIDETYSVYYWKMRDMEFYMI